MAEPASSEDRLIDWLRQRPTLDDPAVQVAIGDDGAVLRLDGRTIAAADAIVEGVHFTVPPASWRDVGFKAMAVNLSDVAAMGCRPRVALDCLALGPTVSDDDAREILAGLEEAAAPHRVALVGGDVTASPGPTMVAVTVLGSDVCGRVVTRDGALAGDEIWVTGAFGGSLAGRHLRPTARVEFALALNSLLPVTAAIDVSDGLARDLHRLAEASRVGARLEAERIPIHADAGGDLERALGDGEDFELLFTVRPGFDEGLEQAAEATGTPIARIGRIVAGRALEIAGPADAVRDLPPTGYGHEWRVR